MTSEEGEPGHETPLCRDPGAPCAAASPDLKRVKLERDASPAPSSGRLSADYDHSVGRLVVVKEDPFAPDPSPFPAQLLLDWHKQSPSRPCLLLWSLPFSLSRLWNCGAGAQSTGISSLIPVQSHSPLQRSLTVEKPHLMTSLITSSL